MKTVVFNITLHVKWDPLSSTVNVHLRLVCDLSSQSSLTLLNTSNWRTSHLSRKSVLRQSHHHHLKNKLETTSLLRDHTGSTTHSGTPKVPRGRPQDCVSLDLSCYTPSQPTMFRYWSERFYPNSRPKPTSGPCRESGNLVEKFSPSSRRKYGVSGESSFGLSQKSGRSPLPLTGRGCRDWTFQKSQTVGRRPVLPIRSDFDRRKFSVSIRP